MGDKELLYQMLSREIDNILISNPMFRMFSGPISNWVISYIDPYVDAFFMGTSHLNTEATEAFLKEEANEKIAAFMKRFKEERYNK